MKEYSCYIGGVKAGTKLLEVRNPYTGELTGTVATGDRCAVDQAIETALAFKATPTRHERYQILDRTRTMLDARRGEISKLMTAESGLCIRETTYEVGRAIDVLVLASHEALRDDGQVFSCDISSGGKSRKIFSMREHRLCSGHHAVQSSIESSGTQSGTCGGGGHTDDLETIGKNSADRIVVC